MVIIGNLQLLRWELQLLRKENDTRCLDTYSRYLPIVWSSTAVFPAAVVCFRLATKTQ